MVGPAWGRSAGPAGNATELLRRAVGLHQAGRLQEAVQCYRQVLAMHPAEPKVLTYCGAALLDLGNGLDAQQMLQSAVMADPRNADALSYLGNAQQMAGKLEAAEKSYKSALNLQPKNALTRNNLGILQQRLGRDEDAAKQFSEAIKIEPKYAQAHNNLSQAHLKLGNLDRALESAETVVALAPSFAEAHNTHGTVLSKLGRTEDAIDAFKKALKLQPKMQSALNNLAIAQIICRAPNDALETTELSLALNAGDVTALATRAVAMAESGDQLGLTRLVDFDKFVLAQHLEPGPGFSSISELNSALVQHICAHPSLVFERAGNTTRQGKHTGDLLGEPKGPFECFEKMINAAVSSYRDALPEDPDHPVVATAPTNWALSMWAVVLEEAGHQLPHIHESGWLSGVYYPKVPSDMGASENDPTGWIEFGKPQGLYQASDNSPVRLFKPEEGMLILFPSYYFHRTVPTGSVDMRVSIAFDVIRTN
jgi:uncharacterized protein (TIGR02466 family)